MTKVRKKTLKSRGVDKFLTICEIHRQIYDEIVDLDIDDETKTKIIDLLQQAYTAGRKMDNRLRKYKYGYDQDGFWDPNTDYEDIKERRGRRYRGG